MIKNHDRIKEIESMGHKKWMIRDLTITFYNPIKDIDPEYHKKHNPKPMYINKKLEIFDRAR